MSRSCRRLPALIGPGEWRLLFRKVGPSGIVFPADLGSVRVTDPSVGLFIDGHKVAVARRTWVGQRRPPCATTIGNEGIRQGIPAVEIAYQAHVWLVRGTQCKRHRIRQEQIVVYASVNLAGENIDGGRGCCRSMASMEE